MTKKLEEMLNLPDNEDLKQEEPAPVVQHEDTFRDIAEFDKIASALPAVKGLGEMADKELNEVADKSMTAYDDLMDLLQELLGEREDLVYDLVEEIATNKFEWVDWEQVKADADDRAYEEYRDRRNDD